VLEVCRIATEKVVPYARNPRKNEEAVAKVAASIKEFGWRQPIVVDKDYVVIAGHTRLMAARSLELKEVPIHVALDLTEAQVKAYRLADNRVAEEAEWDYDLLKLELEDLGGTGIDLGLLGFNPEELDDLLIDPEEINALPSDEDDEIPDEVEAVCQPGDIWQLGMHRICCGDATDRSFYQLVLGEQQVDMVLTDPPYNVNYQGKTDQGMTIKNDNMKDGDFRNFIADVYVNLFTCMREGAPIYVFHADSEGHHFRQGMRNAGLKLSECLVWKKNRLVLGRHDYQWQHEPVLYGWKEGAAHPWYSDRSQTTIMEFDRPAKSTEHPTMKPVELLTYLLGNSSKKGDLVWDSFLGSGSTLIACERTGRRCVGLEIDPHYCDVIIKRWEDLTGQKAERVRGNGTNT
jgi:DNA modification methylase